jgi:YD repeat-containing protein
MTPCSLCLRAMTGALLAALGGSAAAQTQNTTTSYQYDSNGNVTQITDPLGHVTNHSYDALNRLTQQLQPAPATGGSRPAIRYGYDGLDQLVTVTDPRNLSTAYTVNGLGQRTGMSSPDSGASSSTYDAAGNLLIHIDAKGQTTTYSYDVLNRIVRIAHADGNTIDYGYDQGPNGIGRLTRITDLSGTTQYGYDLKGRIVSETRTLNNIPYVTAYGYDNAGRLESVTYPSGRLVRYTRDGAGRISQIDVAKGNLSQTVVSQVVYRPFGGVQSFVNGANQTVNRSFDLDGRIASYTLRDKTQLVTYDAASRITALWDAANAANSHSYGYDNLDRLTQYSGTGASQSFGYDATGNRTRQGIGSGSTSYAYSPDANRLAQASGPSGTQVYVYDANGSALNNGANQFSYDARGRLVAANTPLGLVQYRINALGQRVQKVTPAGTTLFHYDSRGQLIGESAADGSFGKDYIYLHDMPVALFQ